MDLGDSGTGEKVVVRLNALVGPYGALTAMACIWYRNGRGVSLAYDAISSNRAGHVKWKK